MTTEDADGLPLLPGDDGGEVLLLVDEFGVLVQGPQDVASRAIEQLLEPLEEGSKARVQGKFAEGASVVSTATAMGAPAEEFFRLPPEQIAKLRDLVPQLDANNHLRGFLRNERGQFAGDLSFEPVSVGAERAMAMQTAAVSMALRTAIADVQKAVERVEDRVKNIQQHLNSRLRGDVIGTYRHLQEVVEATNERGHLLDADWQSVAGTRNQLQRDLETLRDYVRSEAGKVTDKLTVPKREERLKDFHGEAGSVVDMLRLILVAEQSLHLFEYLRLQQVRQREPEHVESALQDGRKSLRRQHQLDRDLVEVLRDAIERARVISPLEIHHVLSINGVNKHGQVLHDDVVEFAEAARQAPPEALSSFFRPTVGDAREEAWSRSVDAGRVVKEVGAVAKTQGAQVVSEQGKRLGERIKKSNPRRPK